MSHFKAIILINYTNITIIYIIAAYLNIAIYKLVAIRHIKPGDEILWYYGPDYNRDYEVSKK